MSKGGKKAAFSRLLDANVGSDFIRPIRVWRIRNYRVDRLNQLRRQILAAVPQFLTLDHFDGELSQPLQIRTGGRLP